MAIQAEKLVALFEARFSSLDKALKKIGADSKQVFNQMETDGTRAENALQSIGSKGVPNIERYTRVAKGARVETGNLAAQLNDIGVQLAGGQSPFLIALQQGSQINQALGSAGARGAVTALGGAFVSLLNPVSLATIGIIAAGGVAVQYFTQLLSDGPDAEKTLEKQADLIKRVADRWGDALPGVKAYADELKRAEEEADIESATSLAVDNALKEARETVKGLRLEFVDLIDKFRVGGVDSARVQRAFQNFASAVDVGNDSTKESIELQSALSEIYVNNNIPDANEFAKAVHGIADAFARSAREADGAKRSKDEALRAGFVDSGTGGPRRRGFWMDLPGKNGEIVPGLSTPDRRVDPYFDGVGQTLRDAIPAIDAFVDRVVQAESGGDRNAKNPNSSATGAGQFIASTWLDLFRRYYPSEAAGMGREAILALRTDSDRSRTLIEAYAKENAEILQKAGVSVDEAALHLAHFLGAGDAAKVLSAAPGTPLAGLISSASIAANPTVLGGGRTVEDALLYAQRRASATTGRSRKSPSELFQGSMDDVQRRIDVINAELSATKGLTSGTDEYALALEKARIKQELLNAAKKEGLEVTPDLAAKIDMLAGNYAKLSVQQQSSKREQIELNKSAQEFADFGKDVIGGFIRDLRDGKDASEALANALNKVADKLLDMFLDSVFTSSAGGGSGGLLGFLGSLFGLRFASGGPVSGPGGGRDDRIPAMLSNGEYVVNAAATRRNRALLDAINYGSVRKLSEGGLLTGPPPLPIIPSRRNNAGGPMSITVHIDGANGDAHVIDLVRQGVRAGVSQLDKSLNGRNLLGRMQNAQVRYG